MKNYLQLLSRIISEGEHRTNRTGIDALSLFCPESLRFDLREGLPILTTRKQNFSLAVKEILWFMRGETNTDTLDCKIWDAWKKEDGTIGPMYGSQLRNFNGAGYDQVQRVIKNLKENPVDRRHLMTTFNPLQAEEGVLWPCHGISIQFNCSPCNEACEIIEDRSPIWYLDMHMHMRSNDFILGAPTNITEYCLLLTLIAREVNMIPRYYVHTATDAHIYLNHLEGAKEQLLREPLTLPRVEIANKPLPYPGCPRDGSVLEPEDFKLIGYESYGPIKYSVAV